jgi:hypothetical protein
MQELPTDAVDRCFTMLQCGPSNRPFAATAKSYDR